MKTPPAQATVTKTPSQDLIPHIAPAEFDRAVSMLRRFFDGNGYLETHVQNRLSILAACEDPHTIRTFEYAGETWPLPQTGQMWLEHDLLNNKKEVNGFYTLTTSYRAEPNPIPGRHNIIFPMFEFEGYGNYADLLRTVKQLLNHLGFVQALTMPYEQVADNAGNVTAAVEEELCADFDLAPVIITHFPPHSNPFWNMKRNTDGLALKADVILGGMETIGCAERSCNPDEMLQHFSTIEAGQYAQKLFYHFGTPRVMAELKQFLDLPFVPRFGGGIGITRLIAAMKKANLM